MLFLLKLVQIHSKRWHLELNTKQNKYKLLLSGLVNWRSRHSQKTLNKSGITVYYYLWRCCFCFQTVPVRRSPHLKLEVIFRSEPRGRRTIRHSLVCAIVSSAKTRSMVTYVRSIAYHVTTLSVTTPARVTEVSSVTKDGREAAVINVSVTSHAHS